MSTSGGVRSSSNARGGGMVVPRAESLLRQLNDPTDAHEALAKLAGGDPARLRDILRDEPSGVTERMAHNLGISLGRTNASTRAGVDKIARLIAEHVGLPKATTSSSPKSKQTREQRARTQEQKAQTAHAARMAKVEAQIAKLQQQLEQMRQQGPQAATPTRSTSRQQGQSSRLLTPLRHTGGHIDPIAAPNPKELAYVYGYRNVSRALQSYQVGMLRQTARDYVGISGKLPASKNALADLIAQKTTYTRADEEQFHQAAIRNAGRLGGNVGSDRMADGSPWRPDGYYSNE